MIPSLHSWVTRRVLGEFGASSAVRQVVGETARWPDWYWWASNPSHASTPASPTGKPADAEVSRQQAIARAQEYINRLKAAGTSDEAYVWLGALFHWVQDLAVHQGRTNPEHSWQALWWVTNPDWSPAGIRRGLRFSRQLLQSLLLSDYFQKLLQRPDAKLLSVDDQKRVLGERTFSWGVLWDFGIVGWKVGRTAPRVRWDVEKTLLDTFKNI